ncbi:hypothetical protein TNCV_4482741 [Trichonephila clavipes]|nr:hypothetical protein TNCV_4482741 [Trichonephila clavipes]
MIVQFRNEKVSNHGSIPITIDCNVVSFIVFEEGFHQPIKRTKQRDRNFRNITVRVIERDTSGEIYYFLEDSRGFRTRQHGHQWRQTRPPKMRPTWLYRQDFAKFSFNRHYNEGGINMVYLLLDLPTFQIAIPWILGLLKSLSWGYLKSLVYEMLIATVEDLIARIVIASTDIASVPDLFRHV